MPGPPCQAFQQVAQRLRCAFNPWRNQAAGNNSGLQQPQIIARKIKHFRNGGDCNAGIQIHAHQSQQWLVDDAQIGFHRRFWRLVGTPTHLQINRDVQYARPFREVHAEKENVTPAAMRQVHPHRRCLFQYWIKRGTFTPPQQLRSDAQWIISRVPISKHPLVASHGTDAAAYLIG